MDLAKLIQEATKLEKPNEIVRSVNEPMPCMSGVPLGLAPLEPVTVTDDMLVDAAEEILEAEAIEAAEHNPIEPGNCSHMCSNPNCQEWWSHGSIQKCRYPDLANQGLCPKCLTTDTSTKLPVIERVPTNTQLGPDDFIDGKLSPRAQVYYRNDQLIRIKDMSVEQMTYHITFLSQQIEELRVRALQTRGKRAELEEEALLDIPEEERDKFIQALRNGNKKTKRVPSEKKPKAESAKSKEATLVAQIAAQPGKTAAEAKVIANWMLKMNKTQAEVEAWLND